MSTETFMLPRGPRGDDEPLMVTYKDFPVPKGIALTKSGKWLPPIEGGAGGIFYRDSLQPWVIADQAAVTLLTTDLNLFPASLTLLPANYWTVGKTVKLTAWGESTSDATAGNIVVGIGIGAVNPPTIIKKSASVLGTVSKTAFSWRFEAYATCRSTGPAGLNATMLVYGAFDTDPAGLLASTLSPLFVPQSANAVLTFDGTLGTQSLTLTLNRSGTGVWTATTRALYVEALN
jgi:hypothetical protein